MNLYKEYGYVMMMGEDDFIMGVFNLRFRGFEDFFVYYYVRFFWLVLEERYEWDELGLCLCLIFMVNYILDYVFSYFVVYFSILKFVFFFMLYLIYVYFNYFSYVDNDIVWLFCMFVDWKYYDNIVIILFGDYGLCNDDVRNII